MFIVISAMVASAAAAVEPCFAGDCQAEPVEKLSLLQKGALYKQTDCPEFFFGHDNCNMTKEQFSKFASKREAFDICCLYGGHHKHTCHSVSGEIFSHGDDEITVDECTELKKLRTGHRAWVHDRAEQGLQQVVDGRALMEQGNCFPGDARVLVIESGKLVWVTMKALLPGQRAFVGHRDGVGLAEAVLLEFHSDSENRAKGIKFLQITHEQGILEATAGHFVSSVEAGMVPAGKLVVGSHIWSLPAALANQSDASIDDAVFLPSRVLSLHVVYKDGIFAKLTYSGRLVVDGVLASSYSLRSKGITEKIVSQPALIEAIGYDGIERIYHAVMLPLRIVHTYAPMSWRSSSFWSSHDDNIRKSLSGSGLPLYIDFVWRIGAQLRVFFDPLIAMRKLWGRATGDSAAACQGEVIEGTKIDEGKGRLIDKLLSLVPQAIRASESKLSVF